MLDDSEDIYTVIASIRERLIGSIAISSGERAELRRGNGRSTRLLVYICPAMLVRGVRIR
jgi:hypothetical protein